MKQPSTQTPVPNPKGFAFGGALHRKPFGFLARLIFASALFAIIYTQSPLYTSNQNTYFLPGLAQAGYGNLSEDWLANTPDPVPLFSILVNLTYRITQFQPLFYIYYAILMGIYLLSLLGIIELTLPELTLTTSVIQHPPPSRSFSPSISPSIRRSCNAPPLPSLRWPYLALFLLLHSAAWRFLLGRTLGDNWIYLLEDGLADQRLLGPVFQPSAFGVLLVLSIYLFLKEHPYWAVTCAALAASFHPTYLLGAAALTTAYMLLRLTESWQQIKSNPSPPSSPKRNSQSHRIQLRLALQACLPGFVALLAILPILIYTYLNFTSSTADVAAQARNILVNYRIPHHALASTWFDATAVIKLILVGFALFLVRKTRLFWVLGVSFSAAVILTIIQLLSGSTALALLFPWRISTFLVPLSTALILAWGVQSAAARLNTVLSCNTGDSMQRRQTAVKLTSLALILILVFIGVVRLKLDFQRQAQYNDRQLFAYVAAHRQAGQLYLIPTKMQDFRLASGAPAFVDFKNHPYHPPAVLEWYRRVQLATPFYKQGKCKQLPDWIRDEGITRVVLPAEQPVCPGLELVYQDAAYSLYAIPSNEPEQR